MKKNNAKPHFGLIQNPVDNAFLGPAEKAFPDSSLDTRLFQLCCHKQTSTTGTTMIILDMIYILYFIQNQNV